MKELKTKILKIKGDWREVVDDCRATVKKPGLGKEPSSSFKWRVLLAEHDPIRDIEIKWSWPGIKYWIAMHYKTHIWRSRTNTQRNDRQDLYDRNKAPQDTPVDFTGDANAQHLIDTARKRLCYQAADETRELFEDLKITLYGEQPELSDALVPNCVYRCGCPEMAACPYAKEHGETYWAHLLRKTDGGVYNCGISERYEAYNDLFWKESTGEEDDQEG